MLAVNRNQDLLAKTMLVLRRPCTTVIRIAPDEWTSLRAELRAWASLRLVSAWATRLLAAPMSVGVAGGRLGATRRRVGGLDGRRR
jgi:hypothetical protein